jgi:hypothetical protein
MRRGAAGRARRRGRHSVRSRCVSAGTAALTTARGTSSGIQAGASHRRSLSVKVTSYGRLRRSSAVTFRPRARARSASHDQGWASAGTSSSGSTTLITFRVRLSIVSPLRRSALVSRDDPNPMVKPRSSCRITRRPSSNVTNSLTEKLWERALSGVRGSRSQMAPRPTTRPGSTGGRFARTLASGCARQPGFSPLTSRLRRHDDEPEEPPARTRVLRGEDA